MYNDPNTEVTPPLDKQLQRLIKVADNISDQLKKSALNLPSGVTEGLSQIAGNLTRFSRQIAKETEERKTLQALADTGQVINSSLDSDEVLRIVMDTIVRLTGAERGFLMLREGEGEMTIRVARNINGRSIDLGNSR